MFDFDMLVQTAFGSVALWTVVNWALVMSCDFSCSSSVSLLFLVVDLERHAKDLLVLSLVGLKKK